MRLLLLMDQSLGDAVRGGVEEDGIEVELVDSVEQAGFRLRTHSYEAVLIDQQHIRQPGFTHLLSWRRDGTGVHVLVLLPKSSDGSDRAACLDAGADACLLHPLSMEELKARLRALLRRDRPHSSTVRRIHDLEINSVIRSVRRGGQAIHLTPREFDLLQLFATHPGKVLSRAMILQHLYNDSCGTYSNVVDVYVRYLRNKIDKGFETPLILTRWGQGYLLRAEGA